MLPSFKNSRGTNAKVLSKREEKKRINISWNSGLFFQLGIIVSLLMVFLVMEATIGQGKDLASGPAFEFPDEPFMTTFVVESPTVVKTPVKNNPKEPIFEEPKKPSSNFVPVANDDPKPETPTTTTEINPKPRVTTPKVNKPMGPVSINKVEHVPVFPGCESLISNADKKACMSAKMNSFINRRFRAEKFSDQEQNKVQRISVQFTIDKNGEVSAIRANALNEELVKEAKRVIGKLPTMIPGKQGDQNVDVVFMVPILFTVEN